MQDQSLQDTSSNKFKLVFIVRHAKSSWETDSVSDVERPLNERGRRDAPVMAARLKEKEFTPDVFVSSPAKRAKTTASLFAGQYKIPETEIIVVPSLYHAAANTFFEVIASLDNSFKSVALFSHNPGITNFVNLLTEKVHIDNMPTCAIFGVKAFTDTWAGFKESAKEFLLFDYPKNV